MALLLPRTEEALRRIAEAGSVLNLRDLRLRELPPLPPTLTHLDCGENELTELPDLPPTLTELNCGENELTELPDLPPTLTHLDCSYNQLTELPDLPPTLTDLDFGYNPFTDVPDLPPTLTELGCEENQLTQLPDLPPTLKILNCSGNELSWLPALPPTLTELTFNDNELTEMPALPPTLTKLTFNGNQLTELPALPPTLTELWCIGNQLTELPALPPTLTELSCIGNQLTELPALPPTLTRLLCNENQLTELPALPPTLTSLYCGDNQLTVLPALPPTLTHLDCDDNQLTELPALPPTLTRLLCNGNQLTELPPLPATLTELECGNNPITSVVFPFPAGLLNKSAEVVFRGCPLDPPTQAYETLGDYQVRNQVQELWKGYSASDVILFNSFFAPGKKNDVSFCPVCLRYVERQDGCMYMKHACSPPHHMNLYNMYKNQQGMIGWCSICGRVCLGHRHYKANLPTDAQELVPLMPGADPFADDCKPSGGGGFEEKHRRIERLLNYACQLQGEVGKIKSQDALTELIEETWKAGVIRDRGTLKRFEEKKFAFPCVFPPEARPGAEVVNPPVPRPAGEAAPVSHPSPPAECMSELAPTANGQPVFQFIHTQPDGTVRPHPENEWICGEHIEKTLKGDLFTGLCFINPDACKARLYPEELQGKVSAEYLAVYTGLFNEKFKAPGTGGRRRRRTRRVQRKYRGGAGPSIMNKINPSEIQCVLPTKSGRRKTRRGKKSRRRIRCSTEKIH